MKDYYVCVAANSKYVRYLYVMLYSLLINNKDISLHIIVMQRDFLEEDICHLKTLVEDYGQKITFSKINEEDFAMMPTTFRYSLETYFRFKIPEIVPVNVSRILYLDVDIIVNGSIKELLEIDVTGYYFAACRDMMEPDLIPSKQKLFNRNKDLRYFNAGVMIWNLEEIRDKVMFKDFIHAGEELHYDLACVDQDILNYLFYDKTLYLDPLKYNYLMLTEINAKSRIGNETAILHFNWFNPWQSGPKSSNYKIWWKYAKETPFYEELLKEQLERCEEYIFKQKDVGSEAEKQRTIRRCLELLYCLKGRGLLKSYLSKSDERIWFYGAGYMANRLFELFDFESSVDRIVGVFDMNKSGLFHGHSLTRRLEDAECDEKTTIILTPIIEGDKLLNEVKTKSKKATVVSMYTFLKQLEEKGV